MTGVEIGIKKVSDFFHTLSTAVLVFMSMYIFVDIFMRYFKLPAIGDVVELTGYLNVWMVLLPIGIIFRKKQHIEVDIITAHISPESKMILKKITGAVSILFCFIMVYKGISMVIDSYEMGQRSMSWQFKIWPFQLAVPLGFLFLMFEIFFDLIGPKPDKGDDI